MNARTLFSLLSILLALAAGTIAASAHEDVGTSAPVITQAPRSQPAGEDGPLAPVGSGFTYQGQLKNGGNPANGQFDLTFKLFDAASAGNQVGTTLTVASQTVTDGRFTVTLDFGTSAFQGDARWLEIAVRMAGGGTYTTLSPRQPLTATPYAASLVPGAAVNGALSSPTLILTNTTGSGVRGTSTSGDGGTFATSSTTGGFGVRGSSLGLNGIGIYGAANNGPLAAGVYGQSSTGTGVAGYSTAAGSGVHAIYGLATGTDAAAVHGVANNGITAKGVWGQSAAGAGVLGDSGSGFGVYGSSSGSQGVGVRGYATGSQGVGVWGTGSQGVGVWGESNSTGWAGYFSGNVEVTGSCCGAGRLTTQVDHPLDPQNKYLVQAAVQSPDLKSVYDGNVTLDAKGEAVVLLPGYVEALNTGFRYQLTAVGAPGPNLYIAEKIASNRFKIAGGKPGKEVSWQVTGTRIDPYAKAHPIEAEVNKPDGEQGKYQHPTEWDQPESKGVRYEEQQRMKRELPVPPEPGPVTDK